MWHRVLACPIYKTLTLCEAHHSTGDWDCSTGTVVPDSRATIRLRGGTTAPFPPLPSACVHLDKPLILLAHQEQAGPGLNVQCSLGCVWVWLLSSLSPNPQVCPPTPNLCPTRFSCCIWLQCLCPPSTHIPSLPQQAVLKFRMP